MSFPRRRESADNKSSVKSQIPAYAGMTDYKHTPMTYRQAIAEAAQKLKTAGLANSVLEAQALLALATRRDLAAILTHPECELPAKLRPRWNFLLKLRTRRVPLALLAGHKEFFALDFQINRWTLVPRPATETLIEIALKIRPTPAAVVDIGTGCGCIAISLLKKWPHAAGYATDISKNALKVAQTNARAHQVSKRLKFFAGSLLAPLKNVVKNGDLKNNWILTANLPYLNSLERDYYEKNCPELLHEPSRALYAKKNGLQLYFRLLRQVAQLKNPPRAILLEISPEQTREIKNFSQHIWPRAVISCQPDLAGQARVLEIILYKPKKLALPETRK